MNKIEFNMSNLLTKWFVMPNLYGLDPPTMARDDIDNKLLSQISRNITLKKRLLEKRAFAHAQTIFPIEDLTLEPPDYGLGVIPKLTAVDNTNHEALRIIEECNYGIIKLSVIQRLLSVKNANTVLGLLNDNKYHKMAIEKIKTMLGSKATTEEILYS